MPDAELILAACELTQCHSVIYNAYLHHTYEGTALCKRS